MKFHASTNIVALRAVSPPLRVALLLFELALLSLLLELESVLFWVAVIVQMTLKVRRIPGSSARPL
jgi:hypothetical protein